MSKTYFKYLLKTSLKSSAILLIVNFILFPMLVLFSEQPETAFDFRNEAKVGYAAFCIINMAYFLPVFYHKTFQRKDALDMYLALPVKKEKIVATKMIFGALQMTLIWSLTFFIGVLFAYVMNLGLDLSGYFAFYFVALGLSLSIYIFSWFVVATANSVIDSLILIGVWVVASIVLQTAINESFNIEIYGRLPLFIDEVSRCVLLFDPDRVVSLSVNEAKARAISYIICVVISVIALVLTFLNVKKTEAESAGGPNKNIFGYKSALAVLMFAFFFYFDIELSSFVTIVLFAMLIIGYFTLYFIANRKIKVTIEMLIILLATCILGNGLALLF